MSVDAEGSAGTVSERDLPPAPGRPHWSEPVAVAGLRLGRRRRRPSGKPPPLPREIGVSGKLWIGGLLVIAVFLILVIVLPIGSTLERGEDRFLAWLSGIRTGWLTDVMRWLAGIGAEWPNRVVRWAVILTLVVVKRWRHLFVFVGTMLVLTYLVSVLQQFVPRARPLGVQIVGSWSGFAFPSLPVLAAAITGMGVLYTILEPGRPRRIGKWVVGVLLILLVAARLYLGVDHPIDDATGLILGVALSLIAYRLFLPNSVFPVAYRTGRSAHLDLEGPRGAAIRQAAADQLGLTVLEVKPFGLRGSGGSTPMRMVVAGDPDRHLFAKLYAKVHLRADRWYKLGRTILYGSLEDEKAYNSVRRLVQYEDYVLRVMHDSGIACAQSYGFVEITPGSEYLLVTEFIEGAVEITDAEVDQDVIDDALRTIRRMWDAGLAHRDVKPANIMVRDGRIVLIDLAFGELRPSPWRQAVDLANMMIVLGLRADPDLVYGRALETFTLEEIAEAFAATRSVTVPSQSRSMLRRQRKEGRDVLRRYRELAPARRPIAIQRWSLQRIALTLGAAVGALLLYSLIVANLSSGTL
jgi:tRNA A-37 threonylcarbamoyl transferase component Bud32/membrane-associated phospholipid phosphatase